MTAMLCVFVVLTALGVVAIVKLIKLNETERDARYLRLTVSRLEKQIHDMEREADSDGTEHMRKISQLCEKHRAEMQALRDNVVSGISLVMETVNEKQEARRRLKGEGT